MVACVRAGRTTPYVAVSTYSSTIYGPTNKAVVRQSNVAGYWGKPPCSGYECNRSVVQSHFDRLVSGYPPYSDRTVGGPLLYTYCIPYYRSSPGCFALAEAPIILMLSSEYYGLLFFVHSSSVKSPNG